MNCKQGDLAVVVKAQDLRHVGKILRCVKFNDELGCEAWEFEPTFEHFWIVRDASIQPIRDQPGDDETLEWAGLPSNVGVAA